MTTTKQYDLLNRLTNIVNTPSAGSPFSYRYVYNGANQRTNRVEADGSKWNYGYDDLGQVTSGKKSWADGTTVAGQQFDYTFDDIGNRETATANGRTQTYSANDLNQYTSRTVPGYLDVIGAATNSATVTVNATATSRKNDYYHGQVAVGNTNSSVWQPITNVAVIAVGTNDMVTNWTGHLFVPKTPEAFAYDADGNLTNDGRWTYTWDGENRLVAMQTHANAPAGSERRLQFNYDYQSRRVTKRVEHWTNSAWTVTSSNKFLYDRWNLVAELNGTNNSLVQGYIWGLDLSGTEQGAGGVSGLLIIKGQLNGVHYPAYDGNGNVMGTVRASTGVTSAEYDYDPFGRTIRVTGSFADRNPIRFSTKYYDQNSALVYYGYRYYDAALGRWLSRDPLEEGQGRLLLGFVRNAPTHIVDVDGRTYVDTGILPPFLPPDAPPIIFPPAPPPDGPVIKPLNNPCDGYKKLFNAPPCQCKYLKCTVVGPIVLTIDYADKYPEGAEDICNRFMGDQNFSSKAKCVAQCLIAKEAEAQEKTSCRDRAEARIRAHFSCYTECGFYLDAIETPTKGAAKFGLTDVL